jgi:hypothetical protein
MKIKVLNMVLFAIVMVASYAIVTPAAAQEKSSKQTLKDDREESEQEGDVTCGGVERWGVKVFTDPLANTIDWTPKSTTIAHLVSIATPTPSASMPRYQPVEDSTYIFNCHITIKKDESDDDFHLVLSDGTNTLIGEVPDPTCSSVSISPKVAQFIVARNWVVQNIGYGNINNVNLPQVTVTGVAFIDPPHGQTGAAPNYLEIHSIIDIHFTPTGAAPTVTTQAAGSLTTTTALLNGAVNPNNLETTTHFEWGLTTGYGNSTTAASAGSGSAVVNLNSGISALAAGTNYHYRLVAANSAGTTNGNDLTFVTLTPTLSVTPSNQPVTSASGSTAFNLTSNSSWTATSDQTWCTVTSSGSGNGTINATFTGNPAAVSRVAHITITVLGLTPVVVTVTQAGLPVLPEPTNHPNSFSGHNIHLEWIDATGTIVPTSYLIRMSSTGYADIVTPVDGIPVPDGPSDLNVPAGTQEVWFKNLLPNTTYYFKIFGATGSGSSVDYKTDGAHQTQTTTEP